jgi:sulfate transport system permease protein
LPRTLGETGISWPVAATARPPAKRRAPARHTRARRPLGIPPRLNGRRASRPAGGLGLGVATLYLSAVVLIPLAAVAVKAVAQNPGDFWRAITNPVAISALEITLASALAVAAISAVMGTLVAWVLVRDEFPGKRVVSALIDLPFALPTIVAGLTLLALYGPDSPFGVHLAYTRAAVVLALLFVTLPFVVRSVQPVLIELDREAEEAAASLGASNATTFRRIVLPSLRPAIASGAALAFARAVGEYGSLVLLASSKVQIASIVIYADVESDSPAAAASLSLVLLVISVAILFALRTFARSGVANAH